MSSYKLSNLFGRNGEEEQPPKGSLEELCHLLYLAIYPLPIKEKTSIEKVVKFMEDFFLAGMVQSKILLLLSMYVVLLIVFVLHTHWRGCSKTVSLTSPEDTVRVDLTAKSGLVHLPQGKQQDAKSKWHQCEMSERSIATCEDENTPNSYVTADDSVMNANRGIDRAIKLHVSGRMFEQTNVGKAGKGEQRMDRITVSEPTYNGGTAVVRRSAGKTTKKHARANEQINGTPGEGNLVVDRRIGEVSMANLSAHRAWCHPKEAFIKCVKEVDLIFRRLDVVKQQKTLFDQSQNSQASSDIVAAHSEQYVSSHSMDTVISPQELDTVKKQVDELKRTSFPRSEMSWPSSDILVLADTSTLTNDSGASNHTFTMFPYYVPSPTPSLISFLEHERRFEEMEKRLKSSV